MTESRFAFTGLLRNLLARITPFGFLLASLLFFAAVFVLTLGLLSAPKDAVLSATAKSQVFSVEFSPNDDIPAFLSEHGEIVFVPGCDDHEARFSISDPIEVPILVTISADADGVVVAQITPKSEGRFGIVYCGDELITIDDEITQRFPNFAFEQGVVVISRGKVTIGKVPGDNFSPVLLSGTVTASSPSFPIGSGRAIEEAKVSLGQSLRFVRSDSVEDAPMQLVAYYDAGENHFDIAVNAVSDAGAPEEVADTAKINRLGDNEAFTLSRVPSIWARLEAQSEWALILVLVALALNMLGAVRHYMDTRGT